MKKLIFFFALAGMLGASAAVADSDSYIYWMLSDSASGTTPYGQALEGSYTAKISAFATGSGWQKGASDDQYLTFYSTGGAEIGKEVAVTIGPTADNVHYFVNLAAYSDTGWTYFVELWNAGVVVARSSDTASLPSSQASIVTLAGMSEPGTLWAPMAFVPAPEPNSALLLLIGCAALALRRRRQIVA